TKHGVQMRYGLALERSGSVHEAFGSGPCARDLNEVAGRTGKSHCVDSPVVAPRLDISVLSLWMRNDPKPGFVTASQAGSGLLLQFLDGLLEFRCHRRVSMSLRLQRTRTVCINRLGWFAELNESATQP